MPTKNRIIIIPFTFKWNRSADFQRQTCLTLAKNGYEVIAYMNDDATFFLKKNNTKYPKIKNIKFIIPKYYLPLRRIKIIETLNKYLCLVLFNISLLHKKKIIWIFNPQFFYFSIFFINKISIYDCVDFYAENINDDKKIIKNENKLISNSNLFFVNSHILKKVHKNKGKAVNITPQGFNEIEFSRYIKQLNIIKHNKKAVIGYIGGLNYRLDFPLLNNIIKNNLNWKFEFWGPIQTSSLDIKFNTITNVNKLKKNRNVTINKTKNKLKLMNAINNFDVCIIPYDISKKSNLYSYPMKVFEYFYLKLPVVSTPIIELTRKKFKDVVYIGSSHAEFELKIKRVIAKGWSENKKKNQMKLALDNTWDKKVTVILRIIDSYLSSKV